MILFSAFILVPIEHSTEMEPEAGAEETLEREVKINQSFYIIPPHSDPELADCHGFNLKKDFEVNIFMVLCYNFKTVDAKSSSVQLGCSKN